MNDYKLFLRMGAWDLVMERKSEMTEMCKESEKTK